MNLLEGLLRRSIPRLVRLACVLALCALGIICCSVLFPDPLPVILAMSAGHALGGAAFACYLLAVILDATRRPPAPDSLPPVDVDAKRGTTLSGDASSEAATSP